MKQSLIISTFFAACVLLYFSHIQAHINAQENDIKHVIYLYIAANNSLSQAAQSTLAELCKNQIPGWLKIVVHLEDQESKLIKRGTIQHHGFAIQQILPKTEPHISGLKESLYSFIEWAEPLYNAPYKSLIIWGHGTGVLNSPSKSIALNDGFNTELTHQELIQTLEALQKQLLKNQKFSIIGFDACFMSMIEVATDCSPYADYMIASAAPEQASGWNYDAILQKLSQQVQQSPKELCSTIVSAYQQNNSPKKSRYTLAAIDLNQIQNYIDLHAQLLLLISQRATHYGPEETLKKLLNIRMDNQKTLSYGYQGYIDLLQWLYSLKELLPTPRSPWSITHYWKLKRIIEKSIALLKKTCFATATNEPFTHCRCLSLYYPLLHIDQSYCSTSFAQKTKWCEFLTQCCGCTISYS